jgi:hypothetical protein
MRSITCSGRPVISARRCASVDLPPPVLPKTATRLMSWSLADCGVNKLPPPNRWQQSSRSADALQASTGFDDVGSNWPIASVGGKLVFVRTWRWSSHAGTDWHPSVLTPTSGSLHAIKRPPDGTKQPPDPAGNDLFVSQWDAILRMSLPEARFQISRNKASQLLQDHARAS